MFTAVATTVAVGQSQTEDLVNDLRDSVIPKALAGTDLTAYVGGQTAGYIDLAEKIGAKLPLMIAIVVAPQLHRAHARVPLGRDPGQGGGHEPALGRPRPTAS